MNTDRSVDGVLRRYLLGTIDPEVREDVEKRLFSDDQIFSQQLSLAEDELIDAYVSGGLDGEERQSFEQRFLITDERRDKVGFARELKAYAVRERKGGSRSGARFTLPSWAPAAAAAVLVFILPAATWQIARSGAGRDDVSAWLAAGQLRAVGTTLDRLRVPPNARLVRLRLEVDAAKYPAYRATLHLVNGDELWSQSNLRPTTIDDRAAVELTLPAPMLTGDDYFIHLYGLTPGKDPEPIGRFDLRVLRDHD
jgi:hypothetical protein